MPLQRVEWGWHIYNIVESESDPLTREAVNLFEKEPLKGKWDQGREVNLHTPTKFGEDPSKDLGLHREQTNKRTNKRWSNYNMMMEQAFVQLSLDVMLYHIHSVSTHQRTIVQQ